MIHMQPLIISIGTVAANNDDDDDGDDDDGDGSDNDDSMNVLDRTQEGRLARAYSLIVLR